MSYVCGSGAQGDSNADRTALRKSRRVVLGRNVSRVREDGCTLQGRQRETGRRAGDNDLSKWTFLPGADRELTPLRMGRPINASPAGGSSASPRDARSPPVSAPGTPKAASAPVDHAGDDATAP